MKSLFCASVAIAVGLLVGCDRQGDTTVESLPHENAVDDPRGATVESSGLVELATIDDRERERNMDPAKEIDFELTDAAAAEMKEVMRTVEGAQFVSVGIDVTTPSRRGWRYRFGFDSNPHVSEFFLTESNGLKLAIQRDNYLFLNGTTVDFVRTDSEVGFVFQNPNEDLRIPETLEKLNREKESQQE